MYQEALSFCWSKCPYLNVCLPSFFTHLTHMFGITVTRECCHGNTEKPRFANFPFFLYAGHRSAIMSIVAVGCLTSGRVDYFFVHTYCDKPLYY